VGGIDEEEGGVMLVALDWRWRPTSIDVSCRFCAFAV
jgi:hypothetical protein